MHSTPPLFTPLSPSPFPGPEALPEAADVVVVGAGLAGLSAARLLAEAGTDVVLVEAAADVGAGASGRHTGLGFLGLAEHPWRLADALGLDTTRELVRFTREGLEQLSAWVPVKRSGLAWAAAFAPEEQDIRQDVEAMGALGVPVEAWPAEKVREVTGAAALGAGFYTPEEVQLDPARACRLVARGAVEAGARIRLRSPVTRLEQEPDGLRVHVQGGPSVLAQVVVLAAGVGSRAVDGFFAETLHPVREQALVVRPQGRLLDLGVRAGHAYTWWRQTPAGELVIAGARFATPHLEVGEENAQSIAPKVQTLLQRSLERYYPHLAGAEVTHRWAWIQDHSCDGLPLVGPLPGDPRLVACTGFNGNLTGLPVRAARAVVEGLLQGRAAGVPRVLSPGRMV